MDRLFDAPFTARHSCREICTDHWISTELTQSTPRRVLGTLTLDDVLTGEHEPPRSQILWIHGLGQH
jgi:hypothetical protein